uniref:Uncharacterized protein n=1 Tax=Rhizophora mucronata TaxID=61149 RepID=A0A2P2N5F0_RHIMU
MKFLVFPLVSCLPITFFFLYF